MEHDGIRILTAHQVAARLNISPRTVRNLAARHDVGTLVTGRMRLYTEADVERLRQARRPPGWVKGRPRKTT